MKSFIPFIVIFAVQWVLITATTYYGALEAGNIMYGGDILFDPIYLSTKLQLTSAGNLHLLFSGSFIWSSGTAGNSGAYLEIQDDGNLTLWSQTDSILWSSDSGGHESDEPLYLAVGWKCVNMIGENGIIWSESDEDASDWYYSALPSGNRLYGGERLINVASDATYTALTMWSGGALILGYEGSTIFSTVTGGQSDADIWLNIQNDGNLVLRNGSGSAIWSSGTHGNADNAPLYLSVGSGSVCYIGQYGAIWSEGDTDANCAITHNITTAYIFEESYHYSPIKWSNYEQYICSATIINTYEYAGSSYEQCAAACYNEDLCTYFMMRWSTDNWEYDVCKLVYLCNIRVSDSDYWDIYELNRNDTANFVESIWYSDSDTVVWSKKRAFKLWADSSSSTVKLTDVYESFTVYEFDTDRIAIANNGMVHLQSCTYSGCSTDSTLCSADATNTPHTLYVMDYGQIVIKNSIGVITCVIGTNDNEMLEVPYDAAADDAYTRTCSGVDTLTILSDNSASTADYVQYGVNVVASACGVFGTVGGFVSAGLQIGSATYSVFADESSSSSSYDLGIMACIEEYVDYRMNSLSETITSFTLTSFHSYMNTLMDNIKVCDYVECHLARWDASDSHENVVTQLPATLTTSDSTRAVLPLIANLMNIRLLHWAEITDLLNCTDSDCIVEYIQTNDDAQQSLLNAGENFRAGNGQLMESYLGVVAKTWFTVMMDTSISTQEKMEEIEAFWMDGAICSLWIPSTYVMSKEYDHANNMYIDDSYVFDSQDFAAYSYDSVTYDLASGSMGDDCKDIIYEWIAAAYDDYDSATQTHQIYWNAQSELGQENTDLHWYNANDGSTRCVNEPNNVDECVECSSSSYEEWIAGIKVSIWSPDLISDWDSPNSIDAAITDSFPLVDGIANVGCTTSWNTIYIDNSNYNEDFDFFSMKIWGDCWDAGSDEITSVTGQSTSCESGEVAIGIMFYRGMHWADSNEAGFLLWKIRLICYNNDLDYDLQRWKASEAAGQHYSHSSNGGGGASGGYDYEGWSPAYMCAPGYAISKICSTDVWTEPDSTDHIQLNYGMSIQCETLNPSSSSAKHVSEKHDNSVENKNDYKEQHSFEGENVYDTDDKRGNHDHIINYNNNLLEDNKGDYDYNYMKEIVGISIGTSVLVSLSLIGLAYGLSHFVTVRSSSKV